MRADHRLTARLIRIYWKFSFEATRVLEKYIPQRPKDLQKKYVLNLGCGNKFYNDAINLDLFAPHRYFMFKKRPNIFWTGTTEIKYLNDSFKGIVCEHVIEYILPDYTLNLFRNYFRLLKPEGILVVSFPDIYRILKGGTCQGYSLTTVSINSLVYRHGHCFMSDTKIVSELLYLAGFKNIRVASFKELPLQNFLNEGRVPESSYVVGERLCGYV